LLAKAAAFFTQANAFTKSGLVEIVMPLMLKFSTARTVWIP
jgi:hypothetical protein